MLPLQPEREEGADARQFGVPLHPPIPISMARRRSPPPPGAPGEAAAAPRSRCRMELMQVGKAQAADAQWRQAMVRAPTPQQQHLWLGLLVDFAFAFK